jgi:isochorismate synthase
MTSHPLRRAIPLASSPNATPLRAQPSPGGFAADALAGASGDALLRIVVPAPDAGIDALLELLPDEDAFAWATPDGDLLAGAGLAWACTPAGRGRFTTAATAAAALWPRLQDHIHPTTSAPPARLFTGFAFAPAAAEAAPWSGFGDGLLALPRWTYGRDRRGAWLALTVGAADAAAAPHWAARLEELLAALPSPRRGEGQGGGLLSIDHGNQRDWVDNVAAIRRAIVAGRCEKIVAARAALLQFASPPSPTAVLRRLSAAHPGCIRFAVRRHGAVFLGATPERLLSVHGLHVTSEALAGSHATDAAALLASGKERGEHDLVVDAIAATLAPHCTDLHIAANPVAHALRHVVHLRTPIAGHLRRPTPVLDLVSELHPTPAVGGVPTLSAVPWISATEPVPRGWYAGPIGWIDAAGDGELAVALRSGLLRGASAWLWAGAGIVRDSDPEAELAETHLKLGALLDALGVSR